MHERAIPSLSLKIRPTPVAKCIWTLASGNCEGAHKHKRVPVIKMITKIVKTLSFVKFEFMIITVLKVY